MRADDLLHRVRSAIDVEALAAIEQREGTRTGRAKYFDVGKWLRVNVQRALMIGLHEGPPRRVVDLGAGFGYFVVVARVLGHDAIGVDLPVPLYRDVTSALRVPIVEHRIEPRAPLPPSLASQRWDVVTAHMVCFNGHTSDRLWGVREWTTFLNAFVGSTLHLELNREPDGTIFPRGVAELFGDRGGVITARHVLFPSVRGPRLG